MTFEQSRPIILSEPEVIADYGCEIGENPFWHPIECRLYWCDIPKGRIFRYDAVGSVHRQYHVGRPVGGFTVQADGALLLFMDCGTIAIWRECEGIEIVVPKIPSEQSSRFNDVIADPRGRVFCGTMSSAAGPGRLYRLDHDRSFRVILEGVGCSNGMAFSLNQKAFYYTDSFAREIYLFDYDVESGEIRNRRVFARFSESDGFPDGMTLDADGRLWTSLWDGSCIVRLTPDGQVDRTITFPTRKISSLTFGGEDYRDIYVTSAGGNTKDQDGALAGSLFRLKGIGQGRPEFLSCIQ